MKRPTLPALPQLLLQTQLLLRRSAFLLPLGIGALALCWMTQQRWLPLQEQKLRMSRHAASQLQQALSAPTQSKPASAKPLAERHLIRFYDELGERSYVEQQINTLFAIGERAGLTLRQGEYKMAFDKAGGFYTYQVTLPLKGTYSQLRQFSEQTLLQVPFAALDEINFKRDLVANRNLEARLRFTFYLGDADSIVEATENALILEAQAARAAANNPAPKREQVLDPKAPKQGGDDGQEDSQ